MIRGADTTNRFQELTMKKTIGMLFVALLFACTPLLVSAQEEEITLRILKID
jgi:hypothetical protein